MNDKNNLFLNMANTGLILATIFFTGVLSIVIGVCCHVSRTKKKMKVRKQGRFELKEIFQLPNSRK